MKTCTNRIPDNCDSYECGRPVARAGRCAGCLPGAITEARTRLRAMERATGEARARLRALEGDTADHAKRLSEIEALIAAVPGGVWSWEEGRGEQWTLYVNRGEPIDPDWPAGLCNRQHGFNILRGSEETFDGNGDALRAFIVGAREALPWLLAEHRAASDALVAAGIPDDGRGLAERVKALAHDASYGASYRESWERLRRSKDADDIARAQATRDLDILRRAAIATAVSLGEVLPEDAGPETIAASLRRGVGRAKPAAPEERCSTCGEPYTVPPTRRAVVCSNGFHLCRDCTWSKGRRTARCARHATPEMERAEILAASVAPAADDDESAVGDEPLP